MCLNMAESSLQHELHCHHDQGHVAVPGLPLACLILRHSDMTFGILEGALDPEPLALHLDQPDDTGSLRSVTQAVLDGSRRIQLSSDNQMPAVGGRAVFVPQPDSLM